jgi:hypothetical protein
MQLAARLLELETDLALLGFEAALQHHRSRDLATTGRSRRMAPIGEAKYIGRLRPLFRSKNFLKRTAAPESIWPSTAIQLSQPRPLASGPPLAT